MHPLRPIAVALALTCLATACSTGSAAPERSTQNFCSTYHEEKAKFTSKYAGVGAPGSSPLSSLFMGLQSLGDGEVIFEKLDRVAPEDIEPDVAKVSESWKSMEDTMGDEAADALNPAGMFGAMLRGMLMSAQSAGSWQRVGDYVQANCE